MNGVNFFSWIREGVRQSVLLGVSDAVEQLGTPASSEDIHPSVAGLFASRSGGQGNARTGIAAVAGPAERKRLGKSLKDMSPTTTPTATSE